MDLSAGQVSSYGHKWNGMKLLVNRLRKLSLEATAGGTFDWQWKWSKEDAYVCVCVTYEEYLIWAEVEANVSSTNIETGVINCLTGT